MNSRILVVDQNNYAVENSIYKIEDKTKIKELISLEDFTNFTLGNYHGNQHYLLIGKRLAEELDSNNKQVTSRFIIELGGTTKHNYCLE